MKTIAFLLLFAVVFSITAQEPVNDKVSKHTTTKSSSAKNKDTNTKKDTLKTPVKRSINEKGISPKKKSKANNNNKAE